MPIEELHFPPQSIDSKLVQPIHGGRYQRLYDNHCPGLTKLRIFGFAQYDTILYIDVDCVVVQDVSSLLDLNKVYVESEALIAAAPDVFPPDKFNSGVMVLRPNTKVLQHMMGQLSLLTTYDRSDTGFLNAYYNQWYTEMPTFSRLPIGYNAQQVLHDMTINDDDDDDDDDNNNNNKTKDSGGRRSKFWDVQLAQDVVIIHYSNPIKPWQEDQVMSAKAAGTTTITTKATTSSSSSSSRSMLHTLWKSYYQKSQNYLARYLKEQQEQEQALQRKLEQLSKKHLSHSHNNQQTTASAASHATMSTTNDEQMIHKLIVKRYKQLRNQGKSIKDAMELARNELQPITPDDPTTQVASMFGMI